MSKANLLEVSWLFRRLLEYSCFKVCFLLYKRSVDNIFMLLFASTLDVGNR